MKMATNDKYVKIDIDLSVCKLIKLISEKFSKDHTILTKGKITNDIEEYNVFIITNANYQYYFDNLNTNAANALNSPFKLMQISEHVFKITSEEFRVIKNRLGTPFEMLQTLFYI